MPGHVARCSRRSTSTDRVSWLRKRSSQAGLVEVVHPDAAAPHEKQEGEPQAVVTEKLQCIERGNENDERRYKHDVAHFPRTRRAYEHTVVKKRPDGNERRDDHPRQVDRKSDV